MKPNAIRNRLLQSASMPSVDAVPEASHKRLLTRDEIEAEYGFPTRRWLELAAWRGDGPPFLRISRRAVRYDRADFEAWLASRRVVGSGDAI